MFDVIGRQDPLAITHPGFYYGFISVGLAWQVAFIVIARDPLCFRPIMIPSVIEKFGYGASLVALYLQSRLHPSDLMFAGVDVLLGCCSLPHSFGQPRSVGTDKIDNQKPTAYNSLHGQSGTTTGR
jgi:hypothetical protein